MMQERILAVALVVFAFLVGWLLRADPFVLRSVHQPTEQALLSYRNSPYSHVSWVVSPSQQVAELRFFNKVEGGVCTQPSWADLAQLNTDGRLDHLIPSDGVYTSTAQPDKRWPEAYALPNPGTLSHTRYPNLFPIGVLLNNSLFEDPAAQEDWHQASFDCLIVGLGSGVGVSVLLHHFPNASITVVDIDQVVIDMVEDYYPFLHWMSGAGSADGVGPKTADGRPRLQFVAQDARQYVSRGEHAYDLIVLDAYTSGSTIPPHLMTREFYGMLAEHLDPGGMLLSNIIGSYTGPKHHVLTGAMRSMRAAVDEHGQPLLPAVHNFPILDRSAEVTTFNETYPRNNILLSGTAPLDPVANKAGWERLQAFVDGDQLYSELSTKTYIARGMIGVSKRGNLYSTPLVPLDDASDLWKALEPNLAQRKPHHRTGIIADPMLIRKAVEFCQAELPKNAQFGWHEDKLSRVEVFELDLVAATRMTLRSSVELAAQSIGPAFTHSADVLVGPSDAFPAQRKQARWRVEDAPLFTDQRMNADLYTN